jgi:carbon-monoxide dehydrogenase small subunit
MKLAVKITVNGRAYDREIEPRLLLVHFLRDSAGLTGTKIGCDTSQCGSCTVMLDGVAVKSCTCLAAQADGSSVTTIEGLAPDGQLNPIQEAFWAKHGLQCGFCTPGMIFATQALLEANGNPSPEQIRHALEGNLCRCTGYQNIVRSVQAAAAAGGR